MKLRQDDYDFLHISTNKTSAVKRVPNSNPTQQFNPVILGITKADVPLTFATNVVCMVELHYCFKEDVLKKYVPSRLYLGFH